MAWYEIVMMIVVSGLLAMMISTSLKSSGAPLSIAGLTEHLISLKEKFLTSSMIDPERERTAMERLQNKTKTSCTPEFISQNAGLKELYSVNCKSIEKKLADVQTTEKTSWLKFQAMMKDFDDEYFDVAATKNG